MPRILFDPATDYYGLLGVPSSSTVAQLQAAYRYLAKTYHPDVNAGSAVAAARMARINQAKSILLDPGLRALYDGQRERRFGRRTAAAPGSASSAWTSAVNPVSAGAMAYANPEITFRPWRHRSTLLVAAMVIPLVVVLTAYVGGAMQRTGQQGHPFLADLALAPKTRPSTEGVAKIVYSRVTGSGPSVRLALDVNALIDSVTESSPQAEDLRSIGLELSRAAAEHNQGAWDRAVAGLCGVGAHC